MRKKWICFLFFVVLFFLSCSLFTRLTIEKETNNASFYFLNEPPDSLDVVILGSSQVYCGIDPLTLWQQYGIPAFDLATSLQSPWGSYSLAKSAIRTQHPKVIVLDMLMFTEQLNDSADKMPFFDHRVYDPIPLSFRKIWEVLSTPEIHNPIEILFPLLLTHSRIQEQQLTESDFDYLVEAQRQPLKGYELVKRSEPVQLENIFADTPAPLPDAAEKYLKHIIDLCKKESVHLLLIRTPGKNNQLTARQSLRIAEIAGENQLEFLNFNQLTAEIGLDPAHDFVNDTGLSTHLNTDGAVKVSSYLGKYLFQTYGLGDRRDEAAYQSWEADLLYRQNRRDLTELKNLADWLPRLQAAHMSSLIMIYLENGQSLSPVLSENLAQLGSSAIFPSDADIRYLAVVRDGKIISETLRRNKNIEENVFLDGTFCTVLVMDGKEDSPGFAELTLKDSPLRDIRETYLFPEQAGILVYDDFLRKSLDQVSFDPLQPRDLRHVSSIP